MKIVKGSLRNREFVCPQGTRPVLESVRKSCFDILKNVVSGSKCLDLFAGTGALGLEALSLGADWVEFIDLRQPCVQAINQSINQFDLTDQAQVSQEDAFDAIVSFHQVKSEFDLIFLDPPYYQGLLRKALQALEEYDILSPSGYLVGFCYLKDEVLDKSNKFVLVSDKTYGQTRLIIYKKIS